MKKLFPLLMTLSLLLALIPAAHADVLWTPQNNFFEQHFDDCTYVGRSYLANGKDGYVTLWDAPNGHTAAAQYENGVALHVYWQYKNWGCITVWTENNEELNGWVSMDELSLIYDHISFDEEYGAQLTNYAGEFADYKGDSTGFTFWDYPGAAEPRIVWDGNDIAPLLTGSNGEQSYFSKVFVDEEGLTWGYVGYLRGIRNFWVCLDDPAGTQFTLRTTPQTQLIPPAEPEPPASSPLPVALVGAVAAATLALLVPMLRKKEA